MKFTQYLIFFALTLSLTNSQLNAGVISKIKGLFGIGKSNKESYEQLKNNAEDLITQLGSLYNGVMQKNRSINAANQAKVDEYLRNVLKIQNALTALSVRLSSLAKQAINDLENQIKTKHEELKSMTPAQAAVEQNVQNQNIAAKAFWMTISPITMAYNAAASTLEGALNAGKGLVGVRTPEQIKALLEQEIQNLQDEKNNLMSIITNSSNKAYVSTNPKMTETIADIDEMNRSLMGIRNELNDYWQIQKTLYQNINYLGNLSTLEPLQDQIGVMAKELCNMSSYTQAIKINFVNNNYSFRPSAALNECLEKHR